MNNKSKIKIAFLSTYTPRQCGIATYTKSLVEVISRTYVSDPVSIIAVSDDIGAYKYPKEVVFEIDQFNPKSYIRAAEFVNESNIEVINLQHEYGIFGVFDVDDGERILQFLENVNKPVVTTLHSVLRSHTPHRLKVTQRILDFSDTVVVMTENAKKILTSTFAVNPSNIKIVRHGVPNIRFDQKDKVKEKLGFEDKILLSTFGLINRGKGIEFAIESIKDIVAKYPNILYLIIGATHPNVKKKEGESYRQYLESLVAKYKLIKNVKFINRFLDYSDLVNYLMATDCYLSPQQDFNQSFSGALSYAMGCGCAVISSPTAYANEVLANCRGIVVKPNPKIIKNQIIKLLSNGNLAKYQLKAYNYARSMIWPEVGLKKLSLLESQIYLPKEKWRQRLPNFSEMPELDHLVAMTTKIGFVQHAIKSKPDLRFGYSLDDQARALIVAAKLLDVFGHQKEIEEYAQIYLDYCERAVDKTGIIHNFFNRHGKIIDNFASDDSISRSFWALEFLLNAKNIPPEMKNRAKKIMTTYESRLLNSHLRPIAYNLIGYSIAGDKTNTIKLADKLIDRFFDNSENKWRWFSDELTWGNGIIPYALVKAYRLIGKKKYLEVAFEATSFLEKVTTRKGLPTPVGQEEWYFKDKRKGMYDQQPIEAADMVLLFNELYYTTAEKKYHNKAIDWLGWFFGHNINEAIIYDCISHGVLDGLGRVGPNKNQGAESTLVYLLACLSFSKDDSEQKR